MPSQYSDETRAAVISDGQLGRPSSQISRERNLPAGTVKDWLQAARAKAVAENRDPMLVDGEYRRAFLAQQLTEEALQSLKESGDPLHKYLVPLNIIAGTAIDKVFKSREQPSPQNLTQVLVVLNCNTPEELAARTKEYIESGSRLDESAQEIAEVSVVIPPAPSQGR